MYTLDELIEIRRKMWLKYADLEKDRQFREEVAKRIIRNADFVLELRQYPEKFMELFFVIVNKKKKTVPFFLNEVQKDFIKNKLNKAIQDFKDGKLNNISLLVLKGRQQGFTAVITGYQLSCALLNNNFEGLTAADDSSNAESIFENKAKYPYSQLPNMLIPKEKYNNRRELRFDKINSTWSVDTATKQMGRSRTINFLHASECAFWKDGISLTQAALNEALTKDSIKIYESTANGYNDYKIMWDSGEHITCFYEWWRTNEYRMNFENKEAEKSFFDVMKESGWIGERLRWLQNKCDVDQMYWYYTKYKSYIDKDMIKQEYPCSPEEAFVSTGAGVFDIDKVQQRILELKKPIKIGDFKYDYDGLKIRNIEFVNDPYGFIKIYEEPISEYPYVIGGDTAGDGSDNFTGQILNNATGEQVAVLKHQLDEDLYAWQMYCLGIYYNKALIGVEVNYSTFPTKEIERLGYSNLYIREEADTYTGALQKKFGFNTTKLTRPQIIANLVQIMRDHIYLINDKDTLKEALTFIRNKGKPEAQNGYHDDLIMALAIAYHIRSQQSYKIPEIEQKSKFKWTRGLLDDYYNGDDFIKQRMEELYGKPNE